MKPYRLTIYPDRSGEFRWRLSHRNGLIIAVSGESYTRRADAKRAVWRLPLNFAHIEVET